MNREKRLYRDTEKFLKAHTSDIVFAQEIPTRLLIFWLGKRNNRRDRIFKLALQNYQDFTGRQLVFLPDYNAFMDRLCSGKYQWNGFLINKYERLVDPKDPSVVYCCDKEYDDLYTLFFIFVSKIVWGRLLPWRRRRDEMTIFAFDDYPVLFTYRQAQLRA